MTTTKGRRHAGITQPTLVANGDNDMMMQTQNSHLLAPSRSCAMP